MILHELLYECSVCGAQREEPSCELTTRSGVQSNLHCVTCRTHTLHEIATPESEPVKKPRKGKAA